MYARVCIHTCVYTAARSVSYAYMHASERLMGRRTHARERLMGRRRAEVHETGERELRKLQQRASLTELRLETVYEGIKVM
jgi:hypothetical protein